MARMLTFEVFRFNPDVDERPYYDTYQVQESETMNVLEALLEIQHEQDGSLAFRYSCRGAVCGSCAMSINGMIGLADKMLTRNFKAKILVEPLPYLPVFKDLVADMKMFWQNIRKIKPWLAPLEPVPESEWRMSVEEMRRIEIFGSCILCGCCYASCPVTKRDRDFLGPALLSKAYRYLYDPRHTRAVELLDVLNNQEGAWGCDYIYNCVEVCPKHIRPTDAFVAVRKKLVSKFFRSLGF
ncbi:succinate dehydrogenase iron-sulfur subunit [candidate division KSB1 bacterium]|nr:succinate dehydrogenase iron-sulfur subunit [candidate division KSB1 bacterium]